MQSYSAEWLDIANRALALVGTNTILTKMDEGTKESSYVSILLPYAIEAVYASLPFDDVSQTTQLAKVTDENYLGDSYNSFMTPTAMAKLREVITDPVDSPWQLLKGIIASPADSIVIRYVSMPNTPDEMPVYARNLVVLKLGSLLATPVGHNESLTQALESQFQNELSQALTFAPESRMQTPYGNNKWWSNNE